MPRDSKETGRNDMIEQQAKELLAELRSTERDLESEGYFLLAIKLGRIGVGLAAALAACAREAKIEEAELLQLRWSNTWNDDLLGEMFEKRIVELRGSDVPTGQD